MTNWIEIKASFASAPVDWSLYTEVFGRYGIEETLQVDEPASLCGYMADVVGAYKRVCELKKALVHNGAEGVDTQLIPDQDWIENWKRFFTQRRVGRVIICPSWETCAPEEGDIVLDLDPGQAFGTGDHPTTKLCLELLQLEELEEKSVQDLGCGSGILAIAACKLGASPVVAVDIEPQSVQITKDNAKANGVALEAYTLEEWHAPGKADLVFSNIISATLIRLAPEVFERTNPGGKWIVSGVIKDNWQSVREHAERSGFALQTVLEEDEWVGATFRR